MKSSTVLTDKYNYNKIKEEDEEDKEEQEEEKIRSHENKRINGKTT